MGGGSSSTFITVAGAGGGGSCVHAVRVIVQCVLSSFGGGVIHPAALNTCSPGSVFTRDVPTKSYHAGE